MAKVKSIYQCQECGVTSSQWAGQCGLPGLRPLIESVQVPEPSRGKPHGYTKLCSRTIQVSAIKPERLERLGSGYTEFDRVLGGGFVPGSVILVGGAPGAGKEALLLQVTTRLSSQKPCLYVTGEESLGRCAPGTTLGFGCRSTSVSLRHQWRQSPLWLIAKTSVAGCRFR